MLNGSGHAPRDTIGCLVGDDVDGRFVGDDEGEGLGSAEGCLVGGDVGTFVGASEGEFVGLVEGAKVGGSGVSEDPNRVAPTVGVADG